MTDDDKAWQLVTRGSEKLKRLAEDILDVIRIESEPLQYEMQKILMMKR